LSSPSAFLPRVQHSGKIVFPECPIFGTRGSTWHSGNFASPVVSGGFCLLQLLAVIFHIVSCHLLLLIFNMKKKKGVL
jgi:hypothetical protein